MKKIIILIITVIIILTLIINKNQSSQNQSNEELRSIYISYIELQKYVKNDNQELSKKNIDKMINNIKKIKFNTIILQVRVASDAIYPSKIYPFSSYVSKKEGEPYYDVLKYFIEKSHEKGLKLYAWINPYRIRTTPNKETITKENPAYKYLGTDTVYINEGIYYNPSKKEVTKLIVSGVEEIVSNYKVDGILFDDYFYPNPEIDEKDYQKYLKHHDYITGDQYRLNTVSNMVKKVHQTCQKKNIPFGISPDGNIENNLSKNYADVRTWLASKEYLDFIMPQIYYGFYNSTKSYYNVAQEWASLIKEPIDFYIALAFYKVGLEDKYAKAGQDEWIKNDDIIMREIIISRNLNRYKGFALFRYDSIFDVNRYTSTTMEELENMKKILK